MRWHRHHFWPGRTLLCGGHRLAESKHSNDFLRMYFKLLTYDASPQRRVQTISRTTFFMQVKFLFLFVFPLSTEMCRVPCIRHTDIRPHRAARYTGEQEPGATGGWMDVWVVGFKTRRDEEAGRGGLPCGGFESPQAQPFSLGLSSNRGQQTPEWEGQKKSTNARKRKTMQCFARRNG